MSTTLSADEIRTIKGARRIAVWAVVVSLVITAAIGIISIVSGDLDETRMKVMMTTFAVAAFSVLALCHLAAFGRDLSIVGWLGIGTSTVALASSIGLIWWSWSSNSYQPSDFYMTLTKTFGIATIIAVSFAHANLMLLLLTAPAKWIRTALQVTLILVAVVPLFPIPAILTDGTFPPASFQDVYWRLFGVILILDALGTIALPVTTLILRAQHRHEAAAPTAAPGTITVSLPAIDAKWVSARSAESGKPENAVIAALVSAARKQK